MLSSMLSKNSCSSSEISLFVLLLSLLMPAAAPSHSTYETIKRRPPTRRKGVFFLLVSFLTWQPDKAYK